MDAKSEYINSVGIELEGNMTTECFDTLKDFVVENDLLDYFDITHDGSVSNGRRNATIGSAELKIFDYTDNKLKIIEDINNLVYKTGFYTNNSCGMHMHVKFKSNTDTMCRELLKFYSTFTKFKEKYVKDFSGQKKYIDRLGNHYSRDYANREDFMANSREGGDRYRFINYQAFYKHGTIEFRIMPGAAKAEEANRNVVWLVKSFNSIFDEISKGTVLYEKEVALHEKRNRKDVSKTTHVGDSSFARGRMGSLLQGRNSGLTTPIPLQDRESIAPSNPDDWRSMPITHAEVDWTSEIPQRTRVITETTASSEYEFV